MNATSLSIEPDDFDYAPFSQRGGLDKPIPSCQVYKGNVFQLVDQALDFVRSKINLAVGTRAASVQVLAAQSASDSRTGEVTGEVGKLLRVCFGTMSRKELQQNLLLRGEENFRRLYLVPALDAGLIEMTLPDKPNSRLQKYRLTAKGRAWLAAQARKES